MYPILFTIPGIDLPIYSYGVMLGLSLIVGWFVVLGLGSRDGLSREWMSTCYVVSAIFAIASARLLYVLANPEDFEDPIRILEFRQGGYVAYGGFLGGAFGSWWYARLHRRKPAVHFLTWADAVVPSLASGLLITRIGCLLFGCDYGARIGEGSPSWLRAIAIKFPNWATRFPDLASGSAGRSGCSGPLDGSPAFRWHVEHYGLPGDARWSYAVHPTQVYESVLGLALFVVLLVVRRRWRRFSGQLFLTFVVLYGVSRAIIETVRDDPERSSILGFSESQVIGILTAVAAAIGYIKLRRDALAHPAGALWHGPELAEPQPASATPRRRRPGRKR